MKTKSVKLPLDLHRQVRIAAAQRFMALGEFVADTLWKAVKRQSQRKVEIVYEHPRQ